MWLGQQMGDNTLDHGTALILFYHNTLSTRKNYQSRKNTYTHTYKHLAKHAHTCKYIHTLLYYNIVHAFHYSLIHKLIHVQSHSPH